jgi:hypothetical protein
MPSAGFLFSFFASPKKKQKKSPAKDYIPFAGGALIKLKCYCDFSIYNL